LSGTYACPPFASLSSTTHIRFFRPIPLYHSLWASLETSSSSSSPPMLTTIPPRPVSVNSLASPLSSSLSYQKTGRSTSAEIQIHDDSAAPTSAPASADCQSPVDTEMNDNDTHSRLDDPPSYRSEACFDNLPIEIHEAILDCLFGERAPASATVTHGKSAARSWTKALRHPRRKVLSNLSLISPVWRPLVQARIYRHSKYVVFLFT